MSVKTNINREKPARAERHQLLIGSTGELQIWWTDRERMSIRKKTGSDRASAADAARPSMTAEQLNFFGVKLR
jgi:hypothetical protein